MFDAEKGMGRGLTHCCDEQIQSLLWSGPMDPPVLHVVWAEKQPFPPFVPPFHAGSSSALTALAPGLTLDPGEEQNRWGQATSLHLCLSPLPEPWRGVLGLCLPWLLSLLLAGKSHGWGNPCGKCGGYRWGGPQEMLPHPYIPPTTPGAPHGRPMGAMLPGASLHP